MRPRCDTCVFWRAAGEEWAPDMGTCHFEPPLPELEWPRTNADDFCFRHSTADDFPDGSKWGEQ